jgi:inosine-uridine nucleoside N-ribohydrolase/hydroxymethylpyrimidine pyrophosphatase-like HAD family hydrolase
MRKVALLFLCYIVVSFLIFYGNESLVNKVYANSDFSLRAAASANLEPNSQMMSRFKRRKVVLVVDIGYDCDTALATALCAKSKEIELVGIVTIHDPSKRYTIAYEKAKIARSLLNLFGLYDVPVYSEERGTALVRGGDNEEIYSCVDILDRQRLNNLSIETNGGVNFIAEQMVQSKGDVTLICIAPTKVVAEAVREAKRLDPNFTQYANVYVMGGFLVPANSSRKEYNFKVYPEHTKELLESGVHIKLMPSDTTHLLRIPMDITNGQDNIVDRSGNSLLGPLLVKMITSFSDYICRKWGLPQDNYIDRGGVLVHDVLAICSFLYPDKFRWEEANMSYSSLEERENVELAETGNVTIAVGIEDKDFLVATVLDGIFNNEVQDIANILSLEEKRNIFQALSDDPVLAFDIHGTILADHNQPLSESACLDPIIKLLQSRCRLRVISSSGILQIGPAFIDYIPNDLRRNLVIYAYRGARKYFFDEKGNMHEDKQYCIGRTIQAEDLQIILDRIEPVLERCRKRMADNIEYYKQVYPIFFEKGKDKDVPGFVLGGEDKINGGAAFILYSKIPSRLSTAAGGQELDEDERERVAREIKDALPGPIKDRYDITLTGGRNTITVSVKGINKSMAISDILESDNVQPERVLFIGDEFSERTLQNADLPIVFMNTACIGVDENQSSIYQGVIRGGMGITAAAKWLNLAWLFNQMQYDERISLMLNPLFMPDKNDKASSAGTEADRSKLIADIYSHAEQTPGISPSQIKEAADIIYSRYHFLKSALMYKFRNVDFAQLDNAFALMLYIHSGQPRSENSRMPFVLHPLNVAVTLIEEMHFLDQDIDFKEAIDAISVCLLHDTIEDAHKTSLGKAILAGAAGKDDLHKKVINLVYKKTNHRVAEGVVMLTREENVAHSDYTLSFRGKPLYAKVAVMADWLSNFHEMKKAQDRTWVNQAISKRMPYLIELMDNEDEIPDVIQLHYLKSLIRAVKDNNLVNLERGVVAAIGPELIAEMQRILAIKINMQSTRELQRFHMRHKYLAVQA